MPTYSCLERPQNEPHRAYTLALLSLRHFPELWFEYVTYLHELGAADEATRVLHEALDAVQTPVYTLASPTVLFLVTFFPILLSRDSGVGFEKPKEHF